MPLWSHQGIPLYYLGEVSHRPSQTALCSTIACLFLTQ